MSVPKAKRKTDPCPCGSGKQYRYCHGASEPAAEPELAVRRNPRRLFLWIVLIGAPLAYAAGMLLPGRSGETAEGTVQVWSEEHGHYHTVSASQAADAKAAKAAPAPEDAAAEGAGAAPEGGAPTAPPGPAPPGKVWSPEHGHWHDVDGSKTGKELPAFDPSSGMPWDHDFKLEKPDEEREGMVWSEAHGHWHPSG